MRFTAVLALAALLTLPALAQTGNIDPAITPEQEKALNNANWYIPLDYGGFKFEIPAGSIVEKNSKVMVKYPDGSFGMSMENEATGINQKIAFEKARMYATQYKLKEPHVIKTEIAGVKGAKAEGMLESHKVTVLILPVGDQQVTTVLMATPNREEWTRHFIESMKR